MALYKSRGLWRPVVTSIKAADIQPNPVQPRKIFDRPGLEELADSIRIHGVIQPLCVRRADRGYQLISGERRLRASKMAGLTEVPCIVMEVTPQESSILALIENLQRRDLDYIEEAEGLSRLMGLYGLSQEEAARQVGKSQSAVANKLRLLRHSPEILLILRDNNLTERHARALLRLDEESDKLSALTYIIENHLNVAKTEAYIENLLLCRDEKAARPGPKGSCKLIIKDVRIFMNTISHSLSLMQDAGVDASMNKEETEGEIVLSIRIPKMGQASA